jgi:hypothetical protein
VGVGGEREERCGEGGERCGDVGGERVAEL